jgi:hypothetical protein
MFDIETLGIESTSVILSFACIYFDPEKKPTYQELVDSAFFAKLDAKDQAERLKRTVTKSTLDWWTKQSAHAQHVSLTPFFDDYKAEVALEKLREWAKQFPDSDKAIVWARGNLDQMAIGSLENACKVDTVFHFGRWRDVRTAVDLLTGSKNGYCKIEGFDESQVVKHDPIHDCAYDAMMLMYGK